MRPLFLALLAATAIAADDPIGREMLPLHNALREKLHVAPLVWSDKLRVVAQEWANSLLARGQFQHSGNKHYGENLAEFTGSLANSSTKQAFEMWASEAKNYDHKSNKCHGACGHYTQMVWADTKEVGCAVARGRGREVWACEYSPPGNYVGERPY